MDDIEEFGKTREAWLKQYLTLANGIPSHDTFGRVLQLAKATDFEARIKEWVTRFMPSHKGEVIAVDGKTARGSAERAKGKSGLHLVNAFAHESGILLGQQAVDSKTNEITAVPELLRLLKILASV